MTKKVLLFAVLMVSLSSFAQKGQRIGYIDMDYILENIPEYQEAQSQLNSKSITWQSEIDKREKEIEQLKADFNNEKALLTNELIEEKNDDIEIKELELKKLKLTYFGTNGDLYFYRKQLVRPIQDQVFNAVQEIAKKRKYDFILDKSSNLTMLYSNDQFDISDQVIQSITRTKKVDASKNRKKKNAKKEVDNSKNVLTKKEQQKVNEREAKKAELQKKIDEKRAAQQKKREELKKAIEAKRKARLKAIEDAKKTKLEKNKTEKEQ